MFRELLEETKGKVLTGELGSYSIEHLDQADGYLYSDTSSWSGKSSWFILVANRQSQAEVNGQ